MTRIEGDLEERKVQLESTLLLNAEAIVNEDGCELQFPKLSKTNAATSNDGNFVVAKLTSSQLNKDLGCKLQQFAGIRDGGKASG